MDERCKSLEESASTSIEIEKKKILSINQLTFFDRKRNKSLKMNSQIYKTFLSKNLEKFDFKKLIFLLDFNLNKLLNSLINFNQIFYERNKDFKRNNLRENRYIKNFLKQNNNINQTTLFENYLLSEVFIQIRNENNQIINWINKLLIIKSNSKNILIDTILGTERENTRFDYKENKIIIPSFVKNSNELIPQN